MKSYAPYIILLLFLVAGSCKDLVRISQSWYAPETDSEITRDTKTVNDIPPTTGENSNMYLGNPSNAQPTFVLKNNYLIDLQYYTLSYDADRGIPNWVSWHLNKERLANNTRRSNKFLEYSELADGWYKVHHSSYTDTGFDRGHHCPSADRLTSEQANAATFLMVNILPQAPNNNQQVWNNFEMYLRSRVEQGNEIYIIMGSYGQGGIGTQGFATSIDHGRVTVPSNIWKIAVILPEGSNDLQRIEAGEAEIIAIDTPNSNDVGSSWKKYSVTVRAIEKATGYNFLSEINAQAQDSLKLDQAA
ncbi:DNA/RNA non-specific endonuclease [Sphingobacterium corticibacter]|uniref:DNA/RNA non-specific endonuclease n=1 Tax=Sphingobacterium corticibacter TaxID=2171749 RepID=A0A2T8HJ01_9SPHI|nr:DNA/RNA non-specific endonuclease [Sphingobacterium corticibacter]PVH25428.1 DNA/RNA non-specific endonuclease [Sphingobacterium corticibacter]